MKRFTLRMLIPAIFTICLPESASAFTVLDGMFDFKGNFQQTLNLRTHEDVRDVRFSSFRTMFRFEGITKEFNISDMDVLFYGLTSYYYDEGLDLDSNQRRAIGFEAGRDRYRRYRRPRGEEEWLKEVYVDISHDAFQVRIGKQLVSWGETAEARVADLINPLDTKYLIAFPDWEDFKLGLWMAKLFLTPADMWQEMSFEFLIIPYFFEKTRLPPAGSGPFFGTPQVPDRLMRRLLDKQRRDAPDDSMRNLEVGLRIRGYAHIGEGIDWTISHFYTRLDSPLVAGKEGFANVTRMSLGLAPRGKVYVYPHYNSTAFTFSTTWDKIGSSIRGESAYNSKRDYQYGNYKVKEKDLLTASVELTRETMVPYLSEWNRSTAVNISFAMFQYWLLKHEHNKHTGESIRGETGRDSTLTKFTLSLSTGFFYYTLIPILNLVYDTNGSSTVAGGLVYKPGDHWQWMVNYQQLNEQWKVSRNVRRVECGKRDCKPFTH
jgi:hypothetical protein